MPRRRTLRFPLCLALVALAWAQVFGLVRGYVCDCGGQVEITVAEHCHGPHGDACHNQTKAHHAQDDEAEQSPTGGTTQHHDLLKETVVANQKTQTLAVPVPCVMLLAEMPDWTIGGLGMNIFSIIGAESPHDEGPPLRHWPQVLTHTIVLRI